MAVTFTKIHDKAMRAGITAKTAESREWFYRNLKNIRNISHKTLLNDTLLIKRSKPLIGRLFMFFYDPKGKEKLPYYDTFPLIIMVGPGEDGFYGLNLHYLHPRLRAVFFDELMSRLYEAKADEQTRLKITYDFLKSSRKYRLFAPCFKYYLYSQVRSRMVQVLPNEWEIALFLPTDNFEKESRDKIWRESRKYLNT